MNFDFYTAGRIQFGSGSLNRAGTAAGGLGKRFLIVCGGASIERSGALNRLKEQLTSCGLQFVCFQGVSGEPEPDMVEKAVELALSFGCDAVIAIGGGSVIDTGKAAAALMTNGGALVDYLEGVGKGEILTKNPVPSMAIPTTSGTGSEVTKNAVISSKAQKFKKSIRHEKMIPAVALIDPELTLSLPPSQTAHSGMDAMTQLIEAYVTQKANPMTDALSLYGIRLAAKSMKRAFDNGQDLSAREGMSLAALLSGICLANAGLGAAHGMAAALGCYYGIPHGLACSILLPDTMEMNVPAAVERFAHIGGALTGKVSGDDLEDSQAGIAFIRELNTHMGIPANLKAYSISSLDIPGLVQASKGNSMKGNPLPLTDDHITKFLNKLL